MLYLRKLNIGTKQSSQEVQQKLSYFVRRSQIFINFHFSIFCANKISSRFNFIFIKKFCRLHLIILLFWHKYINPMHLFFSEIFSQRYNFSIKISFKFVCLWIKSFFQLLLSFLSKLFYLTLYILMLFGNKHAINSFTSLRLYISSVHTNLSNLISFHLLIIS